MPKLNLDEIKLTSEQRERYSRDLHAVKKYRAALHEMHMRTTYQRDSWLRKLWLNLLASRPWFPRLGRRD